MSKIRNISLGQGSSYSSHINSSDLFKYSENAKCELSKIDAREDDFFYSLPTKRFESYLSPQEVLWLREAYETIYPMVHVAHVPMICEVFNELEVFGEKFVSEKSKGSASCYIMARWAGSRGKISSNEGFRVGKITHFIRHSIAIATSTDAEKRRKTSHIFAKIQWHKQHPRESHLPTPLLVTDTQPDNDVGPATFIPLSRIHSRCAVVRTNFKFDFGQDSVLLAVPLKRKA